jgi:hypothetical protein
LQKSVFQNLTKKKDAPMNEKDTAEDLLTLRLERPKDCVHLLDTKQTRSMPRRTAMGRHHRKWFLDEEIAVNKRVEDMMDDLAEFAEEEE